MSQAKKEAEKRELVAKEEQDDELQTGDFLTLDKCSQVLVCYFPFHEHCHCGYIVNCIHCLVGIQPL